MVLGASGDEPARELDAAALSCPDEPAVADRTKGMSHRVTQDTADFSPSYTGWPRCAASAAIFRGPEVLLVQRGKGALKGWWSLPGGHIEPGETARAAAAREVMEETGIQADIEGLLDVHDVISRTGDGVLAAHYVLAVFYGRWSAGDVAHASDVSAARFVALDDLSSMTLTDGAERLIRKAAERLGVS
jgi:8-oxo-dGTP diphosphatase